MLHVVKKNASRKAVEALRKVANVPWTFLVEIEDELTIFFHIPRWGIWIEDITRALVQRWLKVIQCGMGDGLRWDTRAESWERLGFTKSYLCAGFCWDLRIWRAGFVPFPVRVTSRIFTFLKGKKSQRSITFTCFIPTDAFLGSF